MRSLAVGTTHGAFLTPAQIWLLRSCILHVPDMSVAVGKTHGAAEEVDAGPTLSAVRRYCYYKSVSFVYSDDPTVTMGIHSCCGGGGEKLQRQSSPSFSGPL